MRKSRKKKSEENKRRFEAIKDLMSTFAMSTVAVVAVVTLVPSSPKAEIIKSVPLSEEIVYQVNVEDSDNALDLSTLFVVLENQLEYYEQSVSLGETSGFFDELESETEYRLSVYGNKGFGQERLDTVKVTTGERVGGTILSVDIEESEFESSYLVDVLINDPEQKYESVNLFYGSAHEEDIHYSQMVVSLSRESLLIQGVYGSEPLHIYIEGVTVDGTEVLDEIWITPPFEFYSYTTLNSVGSNEVGFFIYSEQDAEFEMNVYLGEVLVKSVPFITPDDHFEESTYTVYGLNPDTLYRFECIAKYVNPLTKKYTEESVYLEEIRTLQQITYEVDITTEIDIINVTITLTDPGHHFQRAYFEVYDTSGEYSTYITGQIQHFINQGTTKSATFSIPVPTYSSYNIKIGIQNEQDYVINQVIEIITNE